MVSSLIFLSTVLTLMTLNINGVELLNDDPRMEEELKCLRLKPTEMCNLHLTYPPPAGTLKCNQLVPESQSAALHQVPIFQVSNQSLVLETGVVLCFDPDAPMTTNPKDGFNHFLAVAKVNTSGYLVMIKIIKEYYEPKPPQGHGPHRYDCFFFLSNRHNKIIGGTERKMQFCPFIEVNNLGQPAAATQFRFELR